MTNFENDFLENSVVTGVNRTISSRFIGESKTCGLIKGMDGEVIKPVSRFRYYFIALLSETVADSCSCETAVTSPGGEDKQPDCVCNTNIQPCKG